MNKQIEKEAAGKVLANSSPRVRNKHQKEETEAMLQENENWFNKEKGIYSYISLSISPDTVSCLFLYLFFF